MPRHFLITLLLFLPIFGLFFSSSAAISAEKNILIVTHTSEMPYSEVIAGFKAQQKNANFTEIIADSATIAAEIKNHKPDLIFAVGTDATELAAQNTKIIPIVATLILKNTFFKIANVTGVSLSYPFTIQLQWLKKFFPEQNKIAILFNPTENTKTVQQIEAIAVQMGLELAAIPVETPKQMPYALEQLEHNVQLLLAIPDEVAMSPNTATAVLLASFRNRVPLIGLSDNWVKSGALYALSWDYDDLGRQCAMQSRRLLNGEAIQNVAPETPRKIAYSLNAKIAEHMNIVLPDNLLKNAKIVFN